MKLLKIDGYIINLDKICYIFTWGATKVDVHFIGLKKPIELDKDEFLSVLRKEGLLEHERPVAPREPSGELTELVSLAGLTGMQYPSEDALSTLDLLAGEEPDGEESAG